MKKIISILLSAVLCLSQASVFAEHKGPTEILTGKDLAKDKIVSDIYEGGRREVDGELFYVPGTNIVTSDVKFLMDLGVIDHYHPDSALQRNVLKKLFEAIYDRPDMFYDYFPEEGTENYTLSFDEAIVVLMNMSGYTVAAEMQGGTKSDYIAIATQYGFLKHVDVATAQKKLTAKQFCMMVTNAININMLEASFSTDGTYKISDGKTILTEYLGLREINGIVRANEYTSIIGIEGMGEGNIMIEGETFEYDVPSDVNGFLGYRVIAYVDEEDVIQSISVDEKKNSFIELGNNVKIVPSSTKEKLVYYNENDKKKTIKIDKYADLIYNYILCPQYTDDFYVINNGTLKLIDNNGDDIYDVVFKKEYTSFLPLSKNETSGTITDRNSVVYDIKDLLDGKYLGIHAENGEPREFKDFTNTTAVSVLTQKGTNKATELIILDKRTYEGTYQSSRASEDGYRIGDKQLKMSQVYYQSCGYKFPFAIGSNVLVYLDMFDRIIYAETTTSSYKYAWLIKMYNGDNAVNMKLFTEDGVVNRYELDSEKKIKFNDASCWADDLFGRPELYEADTTIAQLIKYKINKDGYINGILTADKTTNCGFGAKKRQGDDRFQMNLNFWDQSKTMKFYAGDMNTFAGKYYYDIDKSVVFGIPTAIAVEREGEDSAYRIITSFEANKAYNVNLYDVDYEYRIGAATMSVSESASKWVNKGYGSQLAVASAVTEIDPQTDEVVGTVHAVAAGGTWSANLKGMTEGYYGKQIEQTHWDYKNLFTYAYPDSKKLSDDPTKTVRDKVKEEYAKCTDVSDIKGGTIFKYTTIDDFVAFYNIEFMIIPDMNIRDHFFEFGWNDSGDDATYSDLYNSDGSIINEYAYDNVKTGLSKTKFYGSEIIAFGQVTEKFVDGFTFNAHVGEHDEEEWNRRIQAVPTRMMHVYNYCGKELINSTVAELEVGDYIFLNMIKGKIQGIVVYRDLPNE